MDVNNLLIFLRNEGGMRKFYDRLPHVTIREAVKEPLTLKQLTEHAHKIPLHSGTKSIDMSTALLYCAIEQIEHKYRGRSKLTEADRFDLADTMRDDFSHWSVADVKCFVDMLVGCRLPTNTFSGTPIYDMPFVDAICVLGKARVYDGMRPTGTVYGGNSPQTVIPLRPLTDEQKTHLLNGMEYDFAVPYEDWKQGYSKPGGDPQRNCERYWRAPADYKNDEYDREAIDRIMAKRKGCVRTLSMADDLSTIRTSRGD